MTRLFEEFQEFRKILCLCPCCNELVRVSDLRLKVKGPAEKTWLDEYENKQQKMDKKEEKFNEIESELRRKATEKGRKEAEKIIQKSIAPCFKTMKLDPFDVKPILNPVDFVVFNGMNKKDSISNIIFLSKTCGFVGVNMYRKQIEKVVEENKYELQVARIDDNGKIVFE
jgi:predicted Holliday junction resolvase-like endonuclease